jgi:hypothetical protein
LVVLFTKTISLTTLGQGARMLLTLFILQTRKK